VPKTNGFIEISGFSDYVINETRRLSLGLGNKKREAAKKGTSKHHAPTSSEAPSSNHQEPVPLDWRFLIGYWLLPIGHLKSEISYLQQFGPERPADLL
jgi:hypothetical protein